VPIPIPLFRRHNEHTGVFQFGIRPSGSALPRGPPRPCGFQHVHIILLIRRVVEDLGVELVGDELALVAVGRRKVVETSGSLHNISSSLRRCRFWLMAFGSSVVSWKRAVCFSLGDFTRVERSTGATRLNFLGLPNFKPRMISLASLRKPGLRLVAWLVE